MRHHAINTRIADCIYNILRLRIACRIFTIDEIIKVSITNI